MSGRCQGDIKMINRGGWTKSEIQFLTENCKYMNARKISKNLNKHVLTVIRYAKFLNIKLKKNPEIEPLYRKYLREKDALRENIKLNSLYKELEDFAYHNKWG